MTFQSPLSRVRGLGSAKSGTHHWWYQRVTAIAMIPLGVWFVTSLLGLVGAEHEVVITWISQPLTAILLILLVINLFYHMQLGLQVAIEDYIHTEARKLTALLVVKFASIGLGVACIFSILKISFGG